MTVPPGEHERLVDLRAAAALAHAVPDAVLTLMTARGRQTVVSFGTDSQLTPCQLRELLASGTAIDLVRRTRAFALGGSFTAAGGGVFERPDDGRREGWFVTSLHTEVVHSLLTDCHVPVPPDSVDVHLLGDTVLDTTVGRVRTDPRHEEHVLEVTRRAHGACVVEQLLASVSNPSPLGDGDRRP